MDFAGAMEVYLGGAWHTFDPRNNARRIGRICVAHGRDAADVAISTAFGGVALQSFRVWTDELSEERCGGLAHSRFEANHSLLAGRVAPREPTATAPAVPPGQNQRKARSGDSP
jgi:hypothetical protein